MLTARNDILKQVARFLDPSKPSVIFKEQRLFVLAGLCGGGKTQIMAKFVIDFGDK
jgi:flagellar biosynthesis GTPase FlhF